MTDNKLIIMFNPHPGSVDENINQVHEQVKSWLASFPTDLSNCTESDIASMKSNCASLRSGKKTIEEERKRIKKEYLKPLDEFEAKVKPITAEIDKAIDLYKSKLDEYEVIRCDTKRKQITEWWNAHRNPMMKPDISLVWDDRYLNKTGIGESWQKDLQSKIEKIDADLSVIGSMNSNLDQLNFVSARYSEHLDLSRAICEWNEHVEALRRTEEVRAKAEAERQAREKALSERLERESQKNEEVIKIEENVRQAQQDEPQEESNATYWAEFRIYGATLDQMKAMTAFIQSNNMHMTILKDEYGNPRKGH